MGGEKVKQPGAARPKRSGFGVIPITHGFAVQSSVLSKRHSYIDSALTVVVHFLLAFATMSFIPLAMIALLIIKSLLSHMTDKGSELWRFDDYLLFSLELMVLMFLFPGAFIILFLTMGMHTYSSIFVFGAKRGFLVVTPMWLAAASQYLLLAIDGAPPLDLATFLSMFVLLAIMINLVFVETVVFKSNVARSEKAETEVSTLSGNLEALFESVGEGLIAADADGKITFANTNARRILDAPEALKGESIYSTQLFLNKDGRALFTARHPFSIVQKTGKPVHYSLSTADTVYTKVSTQDELRQLGLTASPVMQGSEVNGVVAVVHDITDDIMLDKSKTEFVSLASHQLRTPLNTIRWYADRLKRKDADRLTQSQLDSIETISKSSISVLGLVSDLLNASRAELGKIQVANQEVHPKEVLEGILESVKESAVRKGLVLKMTMDQAPAILKNSDKYVVNIVFENLFTNAIKYTEAGSVEAHLHVLPERALEPKTFGSRVVDARGGGVVLEVTDTGIGIPESQQDKIFSKLFRAGNVEKLDVEGTGLGMYLSQQFAAAAGGQIWFDSEENIGSTFFVFMPADRLMSESAAPAVSETYDKAPQGFGAPKGLASSGREDTSTIN